MNRLLFLTTIMALVSCSSFADTTNVWFGTTGPGIHRATFNTETGELSKATQVSEVKSPGFLALHPKKPIIYAVCRLDGPGVAAFRIVGDTLEAMGGQQIGDGGGTHLAVHPSGNFLTTAQ